MTFIPLLGYYLLRPGKPEPPIEERRSKGFTGKYAAVAKFAIEHRWKVRHRLAGFPGARRISVLAVEVVVLP